MNKEDGRVHKRIRVRRKELLETGNSYDKPVLVEDFDNLELKIKQAYKDSNNAAEASGKVSLLVKKYFNKCLDCIIEGPRQTMMDRVLQIKSQING